MQARERFHAKVWWKRMISGICVVLCMILIGGFSAQNGEESGGISRKVAEKVIALEEFLMEREYTEAEAEMRIAYFQLPIRKLAHMSEYALLAMLLVWHLKYYKCKCRLPIAWGIAVLYAVTDEVHQLFVPGRSGKVADVCIDATGALLGVLCLLICQVIYKRFTKGTRETL